MENSFRSVKSKVLGDTFILADDNAYVPIDNNGLHKGMAIYRVSEMRLLIDSKSSEAHLRMVHEIKMWGLSQVEECEE